jgi:hypothetical protein
MHFRVAERTDWCSREQSQSKMSVTGFLSWSFVKVSWIFLFQPISCFYIVLWILYSIILPFILHWSAIHWYLFLIKMYFREEVGVQWARYYTVAHCPCGYQCYKDSRNLKQSSIITDCVSFFTLFLGSAVWQYFSKWPVKMNQIHEQWYTSRLQYKS